MKRVVVALLILSALPALAQYDVLIRNGRVVDGTGNPWFYADVGIVRDRITFIGSAPATATAKRTIDAKGLVVAPGFIDMLGQSELNLLIDKQAFSKLTQGITSEITGEGESAAPQNDRTKADLRDFSEHFHVTIDWQILGEYFDRLQKQGSGVNLGTYVGAAQVRAAVIGHENRPPTADELRQMRDMVEDAMQMGAMGLSTSLIYAPGNYAKTDELIALAQVAAKYGGIYASHIRNEGDEEFPALEEAFRIGREAGLPVEIWHLKVSGRQNWDKMPQVIAAIEHARASGLDVTADQYPYAASATSLGATIPPQFHEGGSEAFVARLKDPAVRAAIRQQLTGNAPGAENMWRGTGGAQGILVSSVFEPSVKKYEGKTIAQIAEAEHKDPLDALMDLVIADKDHVGAIYFTMNEDDVRYAMKQPFVSVDTDYGEVSPTGPLAEGKPHPRAYGTFARILGKYVREQHLLTLEEAIRKMTSLPAHRVKLRDRGELKRGYFADITIFDPQRVNDVATFEDPARPSVGIEYVFVNGVLSLEHEKPTGQLGGRPLRGPGYRGPLADGLPPRAAIQGVVTDENGWPLGRTAVTVKDRSAKAVGSFETRYDGRYEIPVDAPCDGCTVTAERMGFVSQERTVNFNGANSLWFGFALKKAVSR
jgi:N-acyl-D-amino-acid deacylase